MNENLYLDRQIDGQIENFKFTFMIFMEWGKNEIHIRKSFNGPSFYNNLTFFSQVK